MYHLAIVCVCVACFNCIQTRERKKKYGTPTPYGRSVRLSTNTRMAQQRVCTTNYTRSQNERKSGSKKYPRLNGYFTRGLICVANLCFNQVCAFGRRNLPLAGFCHSSFSIYNEITNVNLTTAKTTTTKVKSKNNKRLLHHRWQHLLWWHCCVRYTTIWLKQCIETLTTKIRFQFYHKLLLLSSFVDVALSIFHTLIVCVCVSQPVGIEYFNVSFFFICSIFHNIIECV